MEERLILVDEQDREIGEAEKLSAHREGKLHRGFSIFIFNSGGKLMLQKRARSKYHSGGLWTNACCGHSRPKEILEAAAHRRLSEEMGFDCPIREVLSFIYKVSLDHNLIEHEYLHVFTGVFDGDPILNPAEADEWKWADSGELRREVRENPELFTEWFKLCFDRILETAATSNQ